MPRIRITNMHGFTVEELAKLASKAESPYTRQVLQAVVMTANGIPAEVIAKTLGCCHATVCRCIYTWNEHGLEEAKDRRDGSVGRLTDEMLGDIGDAIRHRSPKHHGYQQNRWTCKLLARYIRDAYGVGYSDEWVRQILHRLGHTYKRGARKPTKANKEAQAASKTIDLLEELTGKDSVCIHALDQTGIRLESVNFYSWGPKGIPCAIEANGSHNGLNIVGSTKILRDYRFYYSSHPSEEGMKAHHVGRFLDKLMSREQGKEVYIIWDNTPTHKATAEEYESKHEGRLHLLFTPRYSPELDPQENIWCWLKAYCARNRAYSTIKQLSAWIGKFQVYTHNTPSKVRKRVDVRLYFKAA